MERIGEDSGTLTARRPAAGRQHRGAPVRRLRGRAVRPRSTPSTATAPARPATDSPPSGTASSTAAPGSPSRRAGRRRPGRHVDDLVPLAPLHNPANLEGLRVARRLFPDVPQVAVFDTAFHQTMPEHAYTYAVPLAWREEHRIRRYGFHGTSHAFVSARGRRAARPPARGDQPHRPAPRQRRLRDRRPRRPVGRHLDGPHARSRDWSWAPARGDLDPARATPTCTASSAGRSTRSTARSTASRASRDSPATTTSAR